MSLSPARRICTRLAFVDGFLLLLLIVGSFAATMGGFAWLGFQVRRRGIPGSAIMGPIDELYNPAAHRFRLEIQVQEQRMVPMPSADDQPR